MFDTEARVERRYYSFVKYNIYFYRKIESVDARGYKQIYRCGLKTRKNAVRGVLNELFLKYNHLDFVD